MLLFYIFLFDMVIFHILNANILDSCYKSFFRIIIFTVTIFLNLFTVMLINLSTKTVGNRKKMENLLLSFSAFLWKLRY